MRAASVSERGLPVGCKPSEAGKHASIALPTAGLHPRAASPQAAHLFQVAGGIRLQLEQSPLHRLLADDRWRAGTSIALPAAGLHPRAASPQAAHLFQVAGGIRHPLEPPPLHCSTVVDESAGSEGSVMGTQHRHETYCMLRPGSPRPKPHTVPNWRPESHLEPEGSVPSPGLWPGTQPPVLSSPGLRPGTQSSSPGLRPGTQSPVLASPGLRPGTQPPVLLVLGASKMVSGHIFSMRH